MRVITLEEHFWTTPCAMDRAKIAHGNAERLLPRGTYPASRTPRCHDSAARCTPLSIALSR